MIKTLKEAWIHAMRSIINSSEAQIVENYIELRNYQISFSYDNVYELKDDSRIIEDYLEMHKVFFSNESNIFGHSYADTIMVATGNTSDPIEAIAKLLLDNNTTRKAVMYFTPYGEDKIPCINIVQFLLRNNVLHISYFARGQDVFRKFPCDAMCIAEFGEKVARCNNYALGTITANITSAHIYLENLPYAQKLISEKQRNVLLTGNRKKYESYTKLLQENHIDIMISEHDIPEIQAENIIEVIKAKAKYAYDYYGFPVWIDDVALELSAFPEFPGAYTKFVLRQLGVEGLKNLLNGRNNAGRIVCRLCRFNGKHYEYTFGENIGVLQFNRPVIDNKMLLNSIFQGEGTMIHRTSALEKLISGEITIL